MKKYILYQKENGTGKLILNNPEKHNAFSPAMLRELGEILDRAAADPGVQVLVLSAKGKNFSSGVDLKALTELNSVEEAKEFALLLEETSEKLFRFPKPVIARLHGLVLGGAAGFAAACDIRIADDDTRIGFPAVKLGAILPATCTVYVESLIGRNRMLDLTLTGRLIDAAEALAISFHTYVTPAGKQDEKIREITSQILEGTGEALSLTKRTVNYPYHLWLEQAKLYATDNFAYLSQTAEWQERMRNFLEKRKK